MYSFTSLNLLRSCKKLYLHYRETGTAFIETPALRYGSEQHAAFIERITNKRAANIFEEQILNLAEDWLPEYHISRGIYHGMLDLYSQSKNIAIEYKTGGYKAEQLDFYAFLTGGEVYLYKDGKELIKHELNEERLKQFLDITERNSKTKISPVCKICVLANTCEVLASEVTKGNIDAIIWLASNYEARAAELKQRLPAEPFESEYHYLTIEEITLHRLKKGVKRVDVVKEIVNAGQFELLDFEPSKAYELFSDYFIVVKQKKKKINEREGGADVN